MKGRSVMIDCMEIQAEPEASILWRLEDDRILRPGEVYGRFRVTANATLVIVDTMIRDEGSYACTATNVAGSSTATSRITVYERPEITDNGTVIDGIIIRPEEPSIARPGNEVRIACLAAVGRPIPDVKWYREGEEVTTNERISILVDGSLRITDAQTSDQGNLTCIATNVVGSDSFTVSLSVIEYENAWIVVIGNCSRSCARGSRIVSSECRRKSDDLLLPDENCRGQKRPLTVREECNAVPCPARSLFYSVCP
jgi:hypothetical protein